MQVFTWSLTHTRFGTQEQPLAPSAFKRPPKWIRGEDNDAVEEGSRMIREHNNLQESPGGSNWLPRLLAYAQLR